MHHRITHILSAIAAILLTTSAPSADDAVISFRSREAVRTQLASPGAERHISLGDSAGRVLTKIGKPGMKLSENAWVYRNIKLTIRGARAPAVSHLVIDFAGTEVSAIRVVSHSMLSTLIEDSKRAATNHRIASTVEP